MSKAAVEPGGGVGLRLVRDLVAGLDGAVAYRRADGRTRITVDLPGGGEAPC
jgi:two-component sensor histidine kinase